MVTRTNVADSTEERTGKSRIRWPGSPRISDVCLSDPNWIESKSSLPLQAEDVLKPTSFPK